MQRFLGMKTLLFVLGLVAPTVLGQDAQGQNGVADVARREAPSNDVQSDRQYAGLVDQARVEGRNNRGGGNRLLEETASAKPDKQFGGLVGEVQVAGRRDRNKEFGGLVGEAQVAGRRRGRGGNHMRGRR